MILLAAGRVVFIGGFCLAFLASAGCQEVEPGMKNHDTGDMDPLITVWEIRAMAKSGSPTAVFAVWNDGFAFRMQEGERVQGVIQSKDLARLQRTIRDAGFYDFPRAHGYVPVDGGMTCIFAQDVKGKRAMCCPLRILPEQEATPGLVQFQSMWKQVVDAIVAVQLQQTTNGVGNRRLRYPGLGGEWAERNSSSKDRRR